MKKLFTWKLWKLMKICAAQGLLAVLICGVSLAYDDYAQVLDKKISVSVSNVSFDRALDAIADAAQAKFAYSSDLVNVKGRVTINVANATVREVLDELLVPRQIRYSVHKDGVTIFLKPIANRGDAGENETGAAVPALNLPVRSLYVTVSGTVFDVNKQPIAGVNVVVKGSTSGTTTDAAGKFSIDAEQNDVLVFSFIGYASQEVHVGNQTDIEVILSEDIQSLGEVVVNAGYWKVTDRERTGNISRVTAEDIKDQPVSNPLMAIQGRMPGVVITQTSGVPGSGMNIQIRGQNSLRTAPNSGNYPLYIVDGVPIASNPRYVNGEMLSMSAGGIDPLNTINPNNIESIEILKDADATAIYGSRGANGVVLITTKKGKAGTTSFDVQVYTGAGRVSKMLNVMNTAQYLSMRNEAFANDDATPGAFDFDLNGVWGQTNDTDWQKKLIGGTANISDMQAFVSGGSGSTSFRFGGGFHRESTVFPGSFGYSKAMGSLNLNHATSDQRFNITLSVNYGRDNNDLFNKNIASYARFIPPNAPIYDEQGNLEWEGYSVTNANPFSYLRTSDVSKTANLIANAVLSYEVLKGLRIVANLGYNDTNTTQTIKTPQSSMNPAIPSLSTTRMLDYAGKNWITEPQLTYSSKIGRGTFDFIVGSTWQAFDTKNLSIIGSGYTSDALLGNVQAAATKSILADAQTEYRYNAVFARLGYNWEQKYLLNFTARRDGSSRFGPHRQFGNFGAVGAGWIFSEENFVKNSLSFLSFGKLRASYGTTGNDQIGDYGYASTFTAASSTYQGSSFFDPTGLSNPDFGWEVNKKLETAIDLTFLRDKVQFSTSWYHNQSSNQLVGYPLAAITGFTTVQYNLDATVQNTGWEFLLNTSNIESTNFSWTTDINVTIPKNKLISYPNLAGSSYANTYVIGQPLTISKRYIYEGIDSETGLYKIADTNGDGTYTDADRQAVVDLSRKYFGGFSSVLTFKGIELNFLIEFVKQTVIDYINAFSSPPGTRYNQLASILSERRWQNPGDNATIQKFSQSPAIAGASYYYAGLSDLNVTDGSYIRLKTISLSYKLPLQAVGITDAQIHVQAQNLFTISDFYGFNPESPYSELPPLRVFSAGVKVKF